MLILPVAIVPILAPFATLFTNPTWQKAQLLLVSEVLTRSGQQSGAFVHVSQSDTLLTLNWFG